MKNDIRQKEDFETAKINPPEFHLNAGASSILLIFVTLCMVAFAVLSIVSANADRKLTGRVTSRTYTYYEACNRAQEVIALMDNELLKAYEESSSSDAYFAIAGKEQSFIVDMPDNQQLAVTLSVQYPSEENDSLYTITKWAVQNIEEEAANGDSGAFTIID